MSYIAPGHESDKYDKDSFDYDSAVSDLWDAGDSHPEEIFEYDTHKAVKSYLGEHGLKPDKYEKDDSSDSDNSSGDDGCYLTTACVGAKGLADDCYELSTLRKFRDTYMASLENGKAIIADYYAKAPLIVKAVNRLPDAESIWNNVYDTLIIPCVKLIENGDNGAAYRKYRDYTLTLFDGYVK